MQWPLTSSSEGDAVTRCAQRWPTTTWSSCSRLVSVELVAAAAVGEAAMLVVLGCEPSGSCRSRAGTGGSGLCVFNLIESYTHRTSRGLEIRTFYVTAVTVVCNGYPCWSLALCVCQGCQAACLARTGPIVWPLVFSFAAVFTDLSLRPSTVQTGFGAPFDYD